MSTIYNLEPPTKGKVILKTSLGDLEIELWPKEAPKACRNFIQMCMEGYYDGTIFHRIIKDYLVQGGDPTGTGEGSESSYGELFKDEFHTRLKFAHRGLVACANQNLPNSNGSQFFITLEKTEWLDRQNTIFGKIVGDTIYNLLRIGDCATDEGDRPLEPPVLKEVEVVWNPFEDIVPRRNRAEEREEVKRTAAAAATAAKKAGSKKNLGLLSFGDEAEEEEKELMEQEEEGLSTKIRSAHDALEDSRLAKEDETPEEERIFVDRRAKRTKEEDEKVAQAISHAKAAMDSLIGRKQAQPSAGIAEDGAVPEGGSAKDLDRNFGSAMHDRMMEKRKQMGDTGGVRGAQPEDASDEEAGDARGLEEQQPSYRGMAAEESGDEDDEDDDGRPKDFKSERNDRIEALRMDNKRKGIGRMTAPDDVENADLLKPWQLAREKYKQRKRLVGDREKATLAKLKQFSQTLKGVPEGKESAAAASKSNGLDPAGSQDERASENAGYNGKVRTDIDHESYLPPSWRVDDYLVRDDLDASLDDLRTHKLSFAKKSGREDHMARNITDNVDDYVVFDPLLEKGKGKFSKAEQDKKKRKNEWSGKANM